MSSKYNALQEAFDDSENGLALVKSKLAASTSAAEELQHQLDMAAEAETSLSEQMTSMEEQLQAANRQLSELQASGNGSQAQLDTLEAEVSAQCQGPCSGLRMKTD